MAALGATIKIGLDSKAVKKGLRAIKTSFAATFKAIRLMTRSFFKILKMSAAGLVGAIGVLAVTLKKTIGYGLKIRQEMRATGRSAKDVLQLREAFRLVGVEGNEVMGILDDMMERFTDYRFYGSEDVGKALRNIGLTFEQAFAKQDDAAGMFELIMRHIEKANLSAGELKWTLDKLFGGKGMELADLGQNFAENMATAKENTEGLAKSLAKEIEAMQEVHKAMGKFQATMRKVGFSIVSRIPLKEIAEAIKGIDIGAMIDAFVKFLKDPVQGIKDFWNWLKTDVLKFLRESVFPALQMVVEGALGPFYGWLADKAKDMKSPALTDQQRRRIGDLTLGLHPRFGLKDPNPMSPLMRGAGPWYRGMPADQSQGQLKTQTDILRNSEQNLQDIKNLMKRGGAQFA